MAVVVPSSDVVNYEMYNGITTIANEITASASNGPLVFQLTKQKAVKQLALVLSLIGSGRILPSNILANETYTVGQDGGEHRQ